MKKYILILFGLILLLSAKTTFAAESFTMLKSGCSVAPCTFTDGSDWSSNAVFTFHTDDPSNIQWFYDYYQNGTLRDNPGGGPPNSASPLHGSDFGWNSGGAGSFTAGTYSAIHIPYGEVAGSNCGPGNTFQSCMLSVPDAIAQCFIIGSSSGACPFVSYTPTITFNFPRNGSTTAPFYYLSAILNNVTSTENYAVTEQTSYLNPLSLNNVKTINGTQLNGTGAYFTRFGYVTAFPVVSDYTPFQYFYMTSVINLYDLASNSYIGTLLPIASATIQWNLIPYTNGAINTFFGTSTILQNYPVWIQATSTNPVTTPWDGSSETSTQTGDIVSSTINSFCTKPTSTFLTSGASDIGNGILYAGCQLINIIVNPNVIPQSTSFLSDQFNTLKTEPPFVGVFGVASSVINGANNASTSYNSISIGILGYPNQQNIDLVDLNSSTFLYGTGTSQHNSHPTSDATNYAETFISMTLWIAASLKILWIFTHPT